MLEDPPCLEHAPVVQVSHTGGMRTYVISAAPDALSPVTERDLTRAWDAARRRSGEARGPCRFRFEHRDGTWTELAVPGRTARRWADAAEEIASLGTFYGLSLCLRLLALSALLLPQGDPSARRRAGADPSRALLRAAAHAPLTSMGGFDAAGLGTLLADAAPSARESRA